MGVVSANKRIPKGLLFSIFLLWSLTIRGQTTDFDSEEFLQAAKGRLCGVYMQGGSFLEPMNEYTFSREWTTLRLNKRFEVLKELYHVKQEAFLTEEGLMFPATMWGDNKPFNDFVSSAIGRYCGNRNRDLSCSVYGRLALEKVWPLCDLSYEGREDFDGAAVVSYTFHCDKREPKTKPGVDADARRAAGTEGRLWFDADSHILVRAEGRYYKNGCSHCDLLFTQIWKGTTWRWNMKRVHGDWVLDYLEYVYATRSSLLTGWRRQYIKDVHRWGDYKAIK